MKIWVTEIGEPLPLEPEARLLRYGLFAPEWVKLGHEVTWWTSSFSHTSKRFVRESDGDEMFQGVRLKFLHGKGYKKNVSWDRVKHQREFARRFASLIEKEEKPDLIVTPIPTIEVAREAVRFGKRHGIPVLVDIRDEWPEEFVDLAPKALRPLARLALTSQFRDLRRICQDATGIVGTGEKFLKYGLHHAKREERASDAVLYFGYKMDQSSEAKVAEAKKYWLNLGVRENAFVCCFFGTIGRFFDLDTVIRAARMLRGQKDFQFVICGAGSSLDALKASAKELPSVIFPGWVDAPKITALMRLSSAGLAPYREGARMSLPNKPVEYFAGGLPVVSSLQGELAGLLRRENAGVTYAAGSESELVSVLVNLLQHPELGKSLGENGKKLFLSRFKSEMAAKNMHQHFLKVVGHA